MQVTASRTGAESARVDVVRDDGTQTTWSTTLMAMVHDVEHHDVETALDLRMGFWGLVNRGEDPATLNAVAHGQDTTSLSDLDLTELRQSEAVVSAIDMALGAMRVRELSASECMEKLRGWCREDGVAPPPGLDEASFDALRDKVMRTWVDWHEGAPDRTQTLTF